MSSPEKKTSAHFALVSKELAAGMDRAATSSDVTTKTYSKPEHTEWCTDAREAQTEANANREYKGTAQAVPDMSELSDRVEQGTRDGQVPIRIEGPEQEMSGFLHRARLAEVEFIPPIA